MVEAIRTKRGVETFIMRMAAHRYVCVYVCMYDLWLKQLGVLCMNVCMYV